MEISAPILIPLFSGLGRRPVECEACGLGRGRAPLASEIFLTCSDDKPKGLLDTGLVVLPPNDTGFALRLIGVT